MSEAKFGTLEYTFENTKKKIALLNLALDARERGEILLALALIATERNIRTCVFDVIEEEAGAAAAQLLAEDESDKTL